MDVDVDGSSKQLKRYEAGGAYPKNERVRVRCSRGRERRFWQ